MIHLTCKFLEDWSPFNSKQTNCIVNVPYPDGESLEDDEGLQLLPGDQGEGPGGKEGAAGHDVVTLITLLLKIWLGPENGNNVAMCPLQPNCWPAICPVIARPGSCGSGMAMQRDPDHQATASLQNIKTQQSLYVAIKSQASRLSCWLEHPLF